MDYDAELAVLREAIEDAGSAVVSFWDRGRRMFVRDTIRTEEEGRYDSGTVAAYRVTAALVDLARVLAEDKDVPGGQQTASLEADVSAILASLQTSKAELLRRRAADDYHMYRASHFLLAWVALDAYQDRDAPGRRTARRPPQGLVALASETHEQLRTWQGGKVRAGDHLYDLYTLHAVRAVDAVAYRFPDSVCWSQDVVDGLSSRIQGDVLRQIGYRHANVASRFDPAELAFSATLLDRLDPAGSRELIDSCLSLIAEAQTADGAWPQARVVPYGARGMPLVSSHEVALALSNLLINRIERNQLESAEHVLQMLAGTFRLVSGTMKKVADFRGWANDRTRWSSLIESWATAVVLSFLIRYRDVVLRLRQREVMSRYDITESPTRSAIPWVDLLPILRRPDRPEVRAIQSVADPTEGGRLGRAIEHEFIRPIETSFIGRPVAASLVITGPPGTSKTSLVQCLARDLGWPLLTLSPPDFLRDGGLEGFESQASSVFKDLLKLRRIVVLFDECEDFFKKRSPEMEGPYGSRTLGAFITAGMLPRLKALRSQHWVVFVLATNSEIDALDPAAIRSGRFDYKVRMGLPSTQARARYLSGLPEDHRQLVLNALNRFDTEWTSSSGTRPESPVAFYHLEKLKARVLRSPAPTEDQLLAILREDVERVGPPSLVG